MTYPRPHPISRAICPMEGTSRKRRKRTFRPVFRHCRPARCPYRFELAPEIKRSDVFFFFFPFFFFFDQSYAFRPVISFFSNVKGKLVNTLENLRSFREKEVKERSCSARSVLFFFLFLEIPKFRIASSNLYEKKLEKKENFNFVKKEGG